MDDVPEWGRKKFSRRDILKAASIAAGGAALAKLGLGGNQEDPGNNPTEQEKKIGVYTQELCDFDKDSEKDGFVRVISEKRKQIGSPEVRHDLYLDMLAYWILGCHAIGVKDRVWQPVEGVSNVSQATYWGSFDADSYKQLSENIDVTSELVSNKQANSAGVCIQYVPKVMIDGVVQNVKTAEMVVFANLQESIVKRSGGKEAKLINRTKNATKTDLLAMPDTAQVGNIYYVNPVILVDKTNEYRAELGMDAVKPNIELMRAAWNHAEYIARRGYWAHETPKQGTKDKEPWEYADELGINWIAYGENIAAGPSDADGLAKGYKQSPEHYKNMINKDFNSIGVVTIFMPKGRIIFTSDGVMFTYTINVMHLAKL